MELENLALIAILAATDAVYIPSREPMSHAHRVKCERRRANCIPWTSDMVMTSRDDAARKHAQRALDELVQRGFVETFQPNNSKTLAVRLTDVGDEYARALVGLPQVETSLSVIEELRKHQAGPIVCDHDGRVWVPETVLTGVRWGDSAKRKAFVHMEEKLLPGLVRGWVESNCSIQGHCYYTLGKVEPGSPPELENPPIQSDDAKGEYYIRIHEEIEVLSWAKLECEREIGHIPMPVSGMREVKA
jgi:hypothetical protein